MFLITAVAHMSSAADKVVTMRVVTTVRTYGDRRLWDLTVLLTQCSNKVCETGVLFDNNLLIDVNKNPPYSVTIHKRLAECIECRGGNQQFLF